MYDVLGELCILTGTFLMHFQWSKVKKNFFEVGVFKQGDVLKQMFQKGHKKVLECI